MDFQKYVDRGAALAEEQLMPDRCTIETTGGRTLNAAGVLTVSSAFVQYNGSTSIPCRLDTSRSFRPVSGFTQEANANEYLLHTPLTVFIKPNDKITVGARKFESRKSGNLPSERFTNEYLVVEVETQAT